MKIFRTKRAAAVAALGLLLWAIGGNAKAQACKAEGGIAFQVKGKEWFNKTIDIAESTPTSDLKRMIADAEVIISKYPAGAVNINSLGEVFFVCVAKTFLMQRQDSDLQASGTKTDDPKTTGRGARGG